MRQRSQTGSNLDDLEVAHAELAVTERVHSVALALRFVAQLIPAHIQRPSRRQMSKECDSRKPVPFRGKR